MTIKSNGGSSYVHKGSDPNALSTGHIEITSEELKSKLDGDQHQAKHFHTNCSSSLHNPQELTECMSTGHIISY